MPIIYVNDGCSCNSSPCTCGKVPVPCEPCTPCDSCADKDPCIPDTGCPILLDTKCVIYQKNGGAPSGLTNLGLPNGSNLEFVLNTLDDYLATLSAYTFPPFVTTCIGVANTTITTISDFMDAVDDQFCSVKHDLNTLNGTIINNNNNLTQIIDSINHPHITSTCNGLIININDTIQQILIKLKDAYCSLSTSIVSTVGPNFTPNDSNTISWFLAGSQGHSPTANVIRSIQSGNILQLLPDGLYVPNIADSPQIISFNPFTNVLTLSGGGGSVTLNTTDDNQTLSLDTGTNELSISGGNTVDLTPILPSFSQTAINAADTNSVNLTTSGTANTNISADVKISSDANNIISIHSDGLYATSSASTDELVKASSAGTAGTLIQKVEGCVSGSITTAVTYNNITDKLTVCSSINQGTLLTEIAGNPTLLTQFCAMVTGCICFKFRLINTDSGAGTTYSYVDCNGVSHTGLSIGASGVIDVCGRQVTPGTSTLYVTNLGFC